MGKAFIFSAIAASALAVPAQGAVLYSNNFDSAPVIGAGVTAVGLGSGFLDNASVGAWNASGWNNKFFRNTSTGNPAAFSTLSLTGLKPHSSISLAGVLGFMESWDGFDGGCCSPDKLELWIDGALVAVMTANNALGSAFNFAGGTPIALYQQVDTSNGFYSDSLADIGSSTYANFAHSGSSLTLAIRASGAGWQGGEDESWGIDNLRITYDARDGAVPEPASWALMLAGFGVVGAAMRRTKGPRVSYRST